MTVDRERQASIFKNWYERNRDKFNEARKTKYHKNAALRKKSREAAKAYRSRARPEEPERRDGMFTTPGVAYHVGVSSQTLRNWETRGLIPLPSAGAKHRLYTARQVQLIEGLYAKLREDELTDKQRDAAVAKVFKHWFDP